MSLTLFFVGALASTFVASRIFNSSVSRAFVIYVWHTSWMVAFYMYVNSFGGDAKDYFLNTPHIIGPSFLGSNLIYTLVQTLKMTFGVTYFECFLLFNIIGAIALIIYDSIFVSLTKHNKSSYIAATIFIFLPSFSFWTSGIGKDGFTVLAISLSLWSMLQFAARWPALVLSIIIAALVRPQISAFIFVSALISILFINEIPLKLKFCLASAMSLLAYTLTPYFLNYISYTDINNEIVNGKSLLEHIEYIQNLNMIGDGALNLNHSNLIWIVFNYLFGPTLFEIKSVYYAAQAFENTLILLIFLFSVYQRKYFVNHMGAKYLIIYIGTFSAICLTAYCTISTNIGIAIRTKWCVLPFLLCLLLISYSKKKSVPHLNDASTSLTQ